MKKFLVLLSLFVAMSAIAAPSRNRYAACKQGADTYAGVAVAFSNMVIQMADNSKQNTKKRNEWIQAIKEIKEEQEAKTFNRLRQVETELVRGGEDYLTAGEWRLTMETAWLIAFNLGTSAPGKSELHYKNAIEDRCLSGRV